MIPAASRYACALAVVCGIFCLANPVDRQLPDTMFHLRKDIVYANDSLGCAKDSNRGFVIKTGNRRSEPPEGGIPVSQHFRGPCQRFAKIFRVTVGRRSLLDGISNHRIERTEPACSDSSSGLRHQFDFTAIAYPRGIW